MKRVLVVAGVLVVAAAAGIAWFKLRSTPRTLVLSGSIEARDAEIGSLVGGRVTKVLVDEGAAVRAGQPVVELDAGLLLPQVREQESQVASADANLEKALRGPRSEEIQRARVDAAVAETNRRRLQPLLAS